MGKQQYALVDDEKTDTYEWVLEIFCEAISNKYPSAIVTDGDNAMRKPLKWIFQMLLIDIVHGTCSKMQLKM